MIDLYKKYCDELSAYDDEDYPDGSAENTFLSYVSMEGVRFNKIVKDDRLVGFLITMVKPLYKSEMCICEAYVEPEYRNRGYMRAAVQAELKTGNYQMIRFMVFDRNPALVLWGKLMEEFGYRQTAKQEHNPTLHEYFYWKVK